LPWCTTLVKPNRLRRDWVWVEPLLHRNVQRFRGGLLFKAHRLLYHSTLGFRVMKKKKGLPAARLDVGEVEFDGSTPLALSLSRSLSPPLSPPSPTNPPPPPTNPPTPCSPYEMYQRHDWTSEKLSLTAWISTRHASFTAHAVCLEARI